MCAQIVNFFIDNEVIKLSKDGIWYSDDIEITHEGTIALFFKILNQTENGYELILKSKLGTERKAVTVEDCALFVRSVDLNNVGNWTARLSNENRISFSPNDLRFIPGRLTVLTKDGEAKFLKPTYYEVLKHLNEDEVGYYFLDNGHDHEQRQRHYLERK